MSAKEEKLKENGATAVDKKGATTDPATHESAVRKRNKEPEKEKQSSNVKPTENVKQGKSDNIQKKPKPITTSATEQTSNTEDKAFTFIVKNVKVIAAVLLLTLAILFHLEVEEDDILIVSKSAVVHGSKKEVFELVGDLKHYPKWFPGPKSVTAEDDSPVTIGKHYTETVQYPIIGDVVFDDVIVGYDPLNLLSFVSDSSIRMKVEILLNAYKGKEKQTLVTYKMTSQMRSYLAQISSIPALKLVYRSKSRQALFNLRTLFRPS